MLTTIGAVAKSKMILSGYQGRINSIFTPQIPSSVIGGRLSRHRLADDMDFITGFV